MTEDVIDSGLDQTQEVVTQDAGNAQVSQPVSQPNYADMVSKQRVNEIVQERTRQAAEKAYQRGLTEAAQKSQSQSSSLGGMRQMSEEDIRSLMEQTFENKYAKLHEDFQRQEAERQINEMAQNFMGKLDAAKDKYPELAKRQNEIGELGTLIPYINESDNTAALTDHLLNNGHTVASLLVLQHTSPVFLRREIQKIANSLKQNEDALNAPRAHEPLHHTSPSVYTTDGGSDSIEALKKQSWLRG